MRLVVKSVAKSRRTEKEQGFIAAMEKADRTKGDINGLQQFFFISSSVFEPGKINKRN